MIAALAAEDAAGLAAALESHREVRVLPEAGTLVLFDATSLHAVLPVASARIRRALTLWIPRPRDDGARGEILDDGG